MKLLEEIDQLISQKDYTSAWHKLSAITTPKAKAVVLRKTKLLFLQEKYAECLHYMKSMPQFQDTLGQLLNTARCYDNLSQTNKAKKAYNEVLKVSPNHVPSLIKMSRYHFSLSEYEECERKLLLARKADTTNKNVDKILVKLYTKTMEWDKLAAVCEKVVEKDANNLTGLLGLVNVAFYHRKDYTEVKKHLNKAVDQHGASPQYLEAEIKFLIETNIEEATKKLVAYHQTYPDSTFPLYTFSHINEKKTREKFGWTAERFIPGVNMGSTALSNHLSRYEMALHFVKDKTIVDIASGEGYGTYLLSTMAASTLGVDISEEAVSAAQIKYKADNLNYSIGSCSAIPVNTQSVDCVVSFETIEHITNQKALMDEVDRILKPDGLLIISTPETKHFAKNAFHQNEFHEKELTLEEFQELLGQYFAHVRLYTQRYISGSMIMPLNFEPKENLKFSKFLSNSSYEKTKIEYGDIKRTSTMLEPTMNIAVCSKHKVQEDFNGSFFEVPKAAGQELRTLENAFLKFTAAVQAHSIEK